MTSPYASILGDINLDDIKMPDGPLMELMRNYIDNQIMSMSGMSIMTHNAPESTTSSTTYESMKASLDALYAELAKVKLPPFLMVSDMVTVPDGLNFPYSKNRSKRQHKKLLKRFGTQERLKPSCFGNDQVVFIHPDIKREAEKVLGYELVSGPNPMALQFVTEPPLEIETEFKWSGWRQAYLWDNVT